MDSETKSEPLKCKKCGSIEIRTDVGSASGRKTHFCLNKVCGHSWPEKNLAAAALGRLGGKKNMENKTPQERSDFATKAVEKRWRDYKLKQNKSA